MSTDNVTIKIKLRDGVNLNVSKTKLVEESSLFRDLVEKQHQNELEFDDFCPDSVILFLKFLNDKKLGELENHNFREIYKLATRFDVIWMKTGCGKWMENKIESVNSDDEKVFIFEECLYIVSKWQEKTLMDSFVTKMMLKDNVTFVSQYLTKLHTLDTLTLDHILMIGGCNPEPFLRSINAYLEEKTELSANIKHLLENMNLAVCSELCEELYLEVLDKIRNLTDISTEDLKFVLQMSTETTRSVSSRKEKRKERTTKIFNGREYNDILQSTEPLSDIEAALREGEIRSMLHVVELLLLVVYRYNNITEESTSKFITTIVSICEERRCLKVSKQHLVMIINALNYSPYVDKDKLITLLNEIKGNDKLSARYEHIQIHCDRAFKVSPSGKKVLGKRKVKHNQTKDNGIIPVGTVMKQGYTFRHPYTRECQEPGKCGFIVLKTKQDDGYWTIELCTKSKDYQGTGLHVHDVISASKMCDYNTYLGSTAPDNKIRVLVGAWGWWWEHWLPHVTDWKYERLSINYDVSDYTVFKRK